ncbi:Beta-galactosidase BoGH2A [Symbiodinium microadriaticum]|uniref:Beta-galactosidase BoGH2A n=1 Tax=Symbiodinium microadriaticum TaxID=2951 RepID=A0A1Q9D0R0_SYMMI|nr:Beta-galactosidase BoGH2A [Symbiodinium microadriaticum]
MLGLRQACWTPPSEKYIVHLLPHWNWEEDSCSGTCRKVGASGAMLVTVWVYSNVEEVELIHPNGTSMGRQTSTPCSHVEWEVPFLAGNLTARGYVKGKVVQSATVHTTQGPKALRLRIKVARGSGSAQSRRLLEDSHFEVRLVRNLAWQHVLGSGVAPADTELPEVGSWANWGTARHASAALDPAHFLLVSGMTAVDETCLAGS